MSELVGMQCECEKFDVREKAQKVTVKILVSSREITQKFDFFLIFLWQETVVNRKVYHKM